MTYFFVFQVMKFDDLKELGSEGAVKVRKWTYFLIIALSLHAMLPSYD
jgi:hypothetical protein